MRLKSCQPSDSKKKKKRSQIPYLSGMMVPEDSFRAKHLIDQPSQVLMALSSCARAHSHCSSHGSRLPAVGMLTLAPLLAGSGSMGRGLAGFVV